MSIRIVHLADLHLDRPFASSGRSSSVSSARREGLRQSLKSALEIAREWGADAFTVGGDLYEAEHITADTVQFVRQLFASAAPMRVFIAPGNHDPYTRASPYQYADWSENVHIFREPRLTPVPLKDSMVIWGAGHDSPAFWTALLEGFRPPNGSPALLLLHGTDRSLALSKDKRAFCPFSETEISAAGFGVALLGHIHHKRLRPESSPLLCYPGSPEPLGFDEEDGHSILLADWEGNAWKVDARDISRWACQNAELDITDLASRDAVIELIRNKWPDDRLNKRLLSRIKFVGQPARSLELDLEAMRAAVRSDFEEVFFEDATQAPFDFDALRSDSTVAGVFVRRMLQRIGEAQRLDDPTAQAVAEKALRWGLTALENREIPRP